LTENRRTKSLWINIKGIKWKTGQTSFLAGRESTLQSQVCTKIVSYLFRKVSTNMNENNNYKKRKDKKQFSNAQSAPKE
jgi:hypothetical protein